MSGESNSESAGLEDTLALAPNAASTEPEAVKPIGPYRLVHLIGEGGMGEVWLAEQVEPVRRRVAIKVIKAGMDTKQVVARFESERQALALMDHPAIAKVFDGGSTPEGRPYFVMEYVAGVPITDHCDTHKLCIGERLQLLAEVCEGVQHAHHKAIIHRDLKPSNVLVSLVDGKAQPKIIDFGISKATGYRLTEKTLFTEAGAVIGTPEYMSPEQADLTSQDVDTRTDVYSLGVILYQLLTGELPFGSRDLRSSSNEEFRRKLKEVEPPKPSAKLSASTEGAVGTAKNRNVASGALHRQLEGDLDAITMKALEKERARRYGTPMELAAEIGRHLRNEPVLARPPSQSYRLRKYVRRHRLGVGVSAGLLALLLAFAFTLAVQARRIARERDRANAERDWARAWVDHAQQLGGSARDFDASDRDVRRFGLGYVQTLDTFLRKARNLREEGDLSGAERLARDTVDLAHRLHDEETYFTIWGRNELSRALLDQGRLAEAEIALRQTLPLARTTLGPDLPLVGWTSMDLARTLVREGKKQEALTVLEDALDRNLSSVHAARIPTEADFTPLQGDPRFEAVVVRAKALGSSPR